MDELLTVKQISEILKVTKDQVYRWIKAGTLDAVRLPSGTLRITMEVFEDFLHTKDEEHDNTYSQDRR